MTRGGRIGVLATLSALSPGWATVVAAGVPGAVLVLVLLDLGFRTAVVFAGVFAIFVGTATALGGGRAWARSPHLRRLSYRQRRTVMASILQGGKDVDPTLAPAVEEQARRLLKSQRNNRRALILVSVACGLNVLAVAGEAISGDAPPPAQVWPVAVLAVSLPVAWHREPRRAASVRAALAAAQRAEGSGAS